MFKENIPNNKKGINIISIFFIVVISFLLCLAPNVKAEDEIYSYDDSAKVPDTSAIINGNNIVCSWNDDSHNIFMESGVDSLTYKTTLTRYASATSTTPLSTTTQTHVYNSTSFPYFSWGYDATETNAFLTFSFQAPKEYVGNYYYRCDYEWSGLVKIKGDIYHTDDHFHESKGKSDTTNMQQYRKEIPVGNAPLRFDATTNGGTLQGSSLLYTKYYDPKVYTGSQNSTEGTFPTAYKAGYPTLGWYTEASGGTKVLNPNGSFASNTSTNGYTSYTYAMMWAMKESKTLYAQYEDALKYSVYLNDGFGNTASTPDFYYKYNYSSQYGSDSSRRCYYFTNSSLSMCVTSPTSGVFILATPPTKTNYTFQGYYSGQNGTGTKYITSGGTWYSGMDPLYLYDNNNNSDVTLYGNWTINKPATPTISGGATKIYNSTDTTLTCNSSTSYETGINKYYSFGYSTTDGGTPSNWTTATTSNTLVIPKNSYVGQRYYSCRVYAGDSNGYTSDTVASATTADTEMTINNASITFNVSSNGGTISGTSPLYSKYGVASLYTEIRNTTAATIPTATKTGYVFDGWYTAASGGTKVINADKTIVASVSGWTNASKQFLRTANSTLYAQFKPANPATPTISGGTTKIYNSTATTLTCATATTYPSGVNKYYSFGYATSDGGTPSNWTTASTTNTLSIAKDAYVGQRWYSCRVYASDGTKVSDTVASATTADTEMTINNAKITFNVSSNGGTISGTSPLYSKYEVASLYTGIRNTTVGTIPTASKKGNSFDGWFTAESDGTKVINTDSSVVASVSGWTNASKQFLRTADSTLYAQFTPNIYSITLNSGDSTSAGTPKVWYEYNTTKTINGETCYYYTNDTLTTCLSSYTIISPLKDHYIFDGYYSEANGGGTKYVTGQGEFTNSIYQKLPSEINNGYTDDIILYANWIGDPITVTKPDNTTETYHYGDTYTLEANNEPKASEDGAEITFKYMDNETTDTTSNVIKSYTPNGWLVNDVEKDDNEVLTLTEDITIKYNYDETKTSPTFPEPTREHYTFDGWFDENGIEVTTYTGDDDITLYAHWTGEEITVTKEDDTTETHNYGDTYTLGVNTTTKTNENGGTVTFKYKDSVTEDTTGTVIKSYEADGWKVNGVEKSDNEVITLTEDTLIRYNYAETKTSPTFPTPDERTHYTFDGWYDEETGGNKLTEYTGDENKTLYAHWIGDPITVTKPDNTTETKQYGDSYDLGTNANVKANEDGGTVTFKYQDDVTEDTTGTVVKSYEPDGWLVNDIEKPDDEVLTLTEDITIKYNYDETKTSPTFPEPTREHYTFDGWYDEEIGGNKLTEYTGDENKILYAHWTGDEITVTKPDDTTETHNYGDTYTLGVNQQAKENDTATVTFKYMDDETKDATGTVTKEYTPNGWLVNGVEAEDNEVITLTEDITIRYNYSDSVTGPTFPTPERTHYTFDGWYDEETGGNKLTEYTELEDKTLYAHWIGDPITVTKPDNTTETHNYGDSYNLGTNESTKENENGATVTFKYEDGETDDTTANVEKSYEANGWLVNDVAKDDDEVLTLTEDITIKYNYDVTKTSPEFPTPGEREHYTFDGWYDESTGRNKVTEYTGDEDTILYAHWIGDEITVTLPDDTTETYHYGDNYTLGINDIAKENTDVSTVTFKYMDGETEDTTGKVTKSYTPNEWYVNDIEKFDNEVLVLTEDITIRPKYTETIHPLVFTDAERENYTFDGWFDEEEGGNRLTEYAGLVDTTVYAHWTLDKPTGLELDSLELNLVKGGTHQIIPTFIPPDTTDDLVFSEYNNEIISVTEEGLVTALAPGETTIKVALASNSEIYKTVSVTVINNVITSESLNVETKDLARIIIGEEPETILGDFLEKITNPHEYIKVYNKDNELFESNEDLITTGSKVKLIVNDEVLDEAIVVIRGDLDEDGYVDVSDGLALQNHIMYVEGSRLDDYRLYAGDVDYNEQATVDDMLDVTDGYYIDMYILKNIDSLNEKEGD